ncbi:TRNA_methyltransferase subunit [Hexamita inflata]|uniref:tRNA (guanine(46)-N(7))-methyltransferase n=2 Tax=Hexamita inflata TaxID=28002 RepID=A0AA86PTQ4_9EUKA|nr:TRNA methyltransferase subunit [Hexamita inflata]
MEGFKQRPDAKSKAYQRFRHRPHANPLSDMEIILPAQRPDQFPFEKFYSMQNTPTKFDCVDIGCGYGDFVANMSKLNQDLSFLGLEIRDKAVAIAQQQLIDKRTNENKCNNAIVLRCNCMRQLPLLLPKQSVKLLTIMFPDPQFKNSKERRRVVSTMLVSEYAYYLEEGGHFLTCTDVEDLASFMHECIKLNGNFEEVEEANYTDLVKCALGQMDGTADAARHQRKDEDKRVFKHVWVKKM